MLKSIKRQTFPSHTDEKSPFFCRLLDQDSRGVAQSGLNERDFNTPCVITQRPHTRPRSPTQQHTSSDTCFSGSFSSVWNLHLKWGKFPPRRPTSHLPLVSERSPLHIYRPSSSSSSSTRFSCSPRTWQLRMLPSALWFSQTPRRHTLHVIAWLRHPVIPHTSALLARRRLKAGSECIAPNNQMRRRTFLSRPRCVLRGFFFYFCSGSFCHFSDGACHYYIVSAFLTRLIVSFQPSLLFVNNPDMSAPHSTLHLHPTPPPPSLNLSVSPVLELTLTFVT